MKRSSYLLAILAALAWLSLVALWFRRPPTDAHAAQRVTEQRIDINSATAAELCLLPGVGPTTAQHILDLRLQRGGRFDAPENLLAVPRLGQSAFHKMRGLIVVGPATQPAQ